MPKTAIAGTAALSSATPAQIATAIDRATAAAVAQYLPNVRFLSLGSSGGTPTNNLSHVATDTRNVGDVVSFRLTASPHQLTFAALESGAVDPDDDTQIACSDNAALHWQILVTAPPVESGGAVTNPRIARVETNGDDAMASIGGTPYATAQAMFDAVQAATGLVKIVAGIGEWSIDAPNGVRDGIFFAGAGTTIPVYLAPLSKFNLNLGADCTILSDGTLFLQIVANGTPGTYEVQDENGYPTSQAGNGSGGRNLYLCGCVGLCFTDGGAGGSGAYSVGSAGAGGNIIARDSRMNFQANGGDGGYNPSGSGSSGAGGSLTLTRCISLVTATGGNSDNPGAGGQLNAVDCTLIGVDLLNGSGTSGGTLTALRCLIGSSYVGTFSDVNNVGTVDSSYPSSNVITDAVIIVD